MSDAHGHDPSFLGVHLPLPVPRSASGRGPVVELASTHFTVLLRTDRRLACATAVNIDGAVLRDLGRDGIGWQLDERVAERDQAGPDLYARNDLDRGHLVRRRDPVWGAPDVAARANLDTFRYTNAAPQVAAFNQSKDLWLGLEDHLLSHADTTDTRLTVLTGPVLHDDDPLYRGVQLPRQFWKVAAWAGRGGLAATAYLLDQEELLEAFLRREATTGAGVRAAEPGAYRTFQVSVQEIADLTGLDLGPLPAADRLVVAAPSGSPSSSVPESRPSRVPLGSTEQIRF